MIAGTGKSFLTSKVIDYFKEQLNATSSNQGFAYFYCKRDEQDRNTPAGILRCILRQLVTTPWAPERMHPNIQQLWKESKNCGLDFLDLSTYQKNILHLLDFYPTTTLIIDALDECEAQSISTILDSLKTLVTQSTNPVKIFVSSRPEVGILKYFKQWPNVVIKATDNSDDIKTFVQKKLSYMENPELEEAILDKLIDKGDGM